MARVLGIIAEYNPFHNGHLYHLQKSIQETDSDYVIAIISGNFVQRGNSSVINKWKKAEMALKSGVNLVIELPTIYSISSAENFAFGAIKILNELKIVKSVSFGTETGDMAALNNIANLLVQEPKKYQYILQNELKMGVSFPKAREIAVLKVFNDNRRYGNIMSSPNNILAIEYLKSIKRLKSFMKPHLVKRERVFYNDDAVVDDFASATAIRRLLSRNQTEDLSRVLPKSSYEILMEEIKKENVVLDIAKYEKEIIYNLRKMSLKQIQNIPDVSEGLEHAIKNAVGSCNNLPELLNMIKSKRYTGTRLQRILICSLLGITKKNMENSKKIRPYVRILGMDEKGKQLISKITKANPKLDIITSVKKFTENNHNKFIKEMLDIDINATDIYTLAYGKNSFTGLDYTNKIVTM
ncbi:MAG: nucleotidyltransferase [Clostridia bacterium]|nr:nucleotidyltransferase [Clostridia bacterium]